MDLNVAQINLHKAKLASENINTLLDIEIFCIQEPYLYNDRLNYLPGDLQCFYKRGVEARAAILARKHINLWFVDEYSSRDVSIGVIKTNDDKKIFIISLYCDQTFESVIPASLTSFLMSNSSDTDCFLICADTNAWSSLWGSSSTNSRGEQFEDWVLSHELDICNTGHTPTFHGRGETFIDVTFSKNLVVENWHVSDQCSFSDHCYIYFSINTSVDFNNLVRHSNPIWNRFLKKYY